MKLQLKLKHNHVVSNQHTFQTDTFQESKEQYSLNFLVHWEHKSTQRCRQCELKPAVNINCLLTYCYCWVDYIVTDPSASSDCGMTLTVETTGYSSVLTLMTDSKHQHRNNMWQRSKTKQDKVQKWAYYKSISHENIWQCSILLEWTNVVG